MSKSRREKRAAMEQYMKEVEKDTGLMMAEMRYDTVLLNYYQTKVNVMKAKREYIKTRRRYTLKRLFGLVSGPYFNRQ